MNIKGMNIPTFDEILQYKGIPNSFLFWASDPSTLTGNMTITIAKRSSDGAIYKSNNFGRYSGRTMTFLKLKTSVMEIDRLSLVSQIVDLLNGGNPIPEIFNYGPIRSKKDWKALALWVDNLTHRKIIMSNSDEQ